MYAAEAEVLTAWPRHVTGHKLTSLRKQGQTPGILFSLPHNTSQLVALDSKEITHTVGAAPASVFRECRASRSTHVLLLSPALERLLCLPADGWRALRATGQAVWKDRPGQQALHPASPWRRGGGDRLPRSGTPSPFGRALTRHTPLLLSFTLTLLCVQPRQVHRNAVTDVVENVTFLHCPPERRILVHIPVRVRSKRRSCMDSQ